jgi:hypothetical protein
LWIDWLLRSETKKWALDKDDYKFPLLRSELQILISRRYRNNIFVKF